jgi:hypothetical protein
VIRPVSAQLQHRHWKKAADTASRAARLFREALSKLHTLTPEPGFAGAQQQLSTGLSRYAGGASAIAVGSQRRDVNEIRRGIRLYNSGNAPVRQAGRAFQQLVAGMVAAVDTQRTYISGMIDVVNVITQGNLQLAALGADVKTPNYRLAGLDANGALVDYEDAQVLISKLTVPSQYSSQTAMLGQGLARYVAGMKVVIKGIAAKNTVSIQRGLRTVNSGTPLVKKAIELLP